jgi:hypothetical protein
MVKRGRHPAAQARFETARRVAALLREGTDVLTPDSLELPPDLDERPLDAYWRIDVPTLADLWPDLSPRQRPGALRDLGRLIGRVHRVRTAGHGDLTGAMERATPTSQVLAEELGGRLMPAVAAGWPEAVPLVEVLLEMIPDVARHTQAGAVLLHGDLHMRNVLCAREGEDVRCVGLLDLECAHAGPPESDLARLSVLQTDLFQMAVEGPWMDRVTEGYPDPVDPVLLRYFTVYHLLHLGCHSAWIGHDVHARHVAAAAREAVAGLRRSRSPARAPRAAGDGHPVLQSAGPERSARAPLPRPA